MSSYQYYREARDMAWEALLRLDEKKLPIDVEALARKIGAELLPFPVEEEQPKLTALLRENGAPCVSIQIQGRWHIFVKGTLTLEQRRFAIAHELGHILLCHSTKSLMPGLRIMESRENPGDLLDDPLSLLDYEADIFAIRLLAPACLLHEMHIDQPGAIRSLCQLPPKAAAVRAERMALLNRRDAFFTHALERQVREQFQPYLQKWRLDEWGKPEKEMEIPLEISAEEAPEAKQGEDENEAPFAEWKPQIPEPGSDAVPISSAEECPEKPPRIPPERSPRNGEAPEEKAAPKGKRFSKPYRKSLWIGLSVALIVGAAVLIGLLLS